MFVFWRRQAASFSKDGGRQWRPSPDALRCGGQGGGHPSLGELCRASKLALPEGSSLGKRTDDWGQKKSQRGGLFSFSSLSS